MNDLNTELDALFAHKPDRLFTPKLRNEPLPVLTPPSTFHHQHLDERMTLKRIVYSPTFAAHLSTFVAKSYQTIDEEHVFLPSLEAGFDTLTTLLHSLTPLAGRVDAKSIGRAYETVTAHLAGQLTSTLSLHYRTSWWYTSIVFKHGALAHPKGCDSEAFNENFSISLLRPNSGDDELGLYEISNEAWESMDEATQKLLVEVWKRFPILALWQMFCATEQSADVLKAMEGLASQEISAKSTVVAPGYRPSRRVTTPGPDAMDTTWFTTLSPFAQDSLRTCSAEKQDSEDDLPHWADVTVDSAAEEALGSASNDTIAKCAIQRAWTRAVEEDSSFAVFHCGNFERIAYRHRSSQTFFISELIDVANFDNPPYGELHVGLYMAILADVFDRTQQLVQADANTMHLGDALSAPIGYGSTGDVYAGSIELLSSTGGTLSLPNVAIKFAFAPKQQKRIQHEFQIHQHLRSSGVTGIPLVIGLFQDTQSGIMALVMNDVGRSLAHRIPENEGDALFSVSPSER
ncbi:hypothetical protein DXG03_003548 [Asterophora parasitica]|uniref:Uncharacterized protein n=1 Tax=Asterophora parasitica TaxID=117018 RepID=A0A9P7KAJ3_9AGAR|nr:hypothetical protein DXG03_003548 [Asterophora parasitica]